MQIFLQYCYSAILCLELHCSKYCKKVIIFYLTLSSLSLISRLWLSLSSVSHLSYLSLISVSPSSLNLAAATQRHITPSATATRNPAPYHAHLSSLSLIPVSSSLNPAPTTQHHTTPSATATRNPTPQSTAQKFVTHEFVIHDPRFNTAKPTQQNQHGETNTTIHDPRSTIGAMRVWAHYGTNEVLGFIEAELWNLGFFVCGFCWLMCFWLIYEVLGVWVDGLLLDYFTTSLEMKAPAEVTNRRELKMRERREMGEKI